jgi:hypothetical protein
MVGIEAALVLQGSMPIGPESGIPLMQVGFLISAGGMLIYAGRIIGKWQTAQETLIAKVALVDKANIQLQKDVAFLRGQVRLLETRTRLPGEHEDVG